MQLLVAILERDLDGLKGALDRGANARGLDEQDVPVLLHACDTGLVSFVRPLLDAGADLETTDGIGWTPLMAAVAKGSDELVAFLLQRGADANHLAREDTPLTIAVTDAPIGIVRLLLRSGAKVDLRRPDGWTPLMLAAHRGEFDRLHVLLEAGADPTITMSSRLTDAAMIAALHGHSRVRDQLVEASENRSQSVARVWRSIGVWCADQGIDVSVPEPGEPEFPSEWPTLPAPAVAWFAHAASQPVFGYRVVDIGTSTRLARAASVEPPTAGALGADEPIQRVGWSDQWIPLAQKGNGQLLLLDLAPLDTGVPGQVISWAPHTGPVEVLASGVLPVLQHFLAQLRRGRLVFVDGTFVAG